MAQVAFAGGGLLQVAGASPASWWAAYLVCGLVGGWGPARDGLRAVTERRLEVDLLMVAAAVGAAALGQVFDAALLIVIFATSAALEAVASQRTADSVRSLLDLAPPRVTRLAPGGREDVVAPDALEVDDLVLVRPGERIGADGRVVDGSSEVDQATITGEPLPVLREPGDDVFAGTLNGPGALRVRVTRPAGDTVVARIVAMVQEARSSTAPTQLLVERVEQRYSVAVVTATLALVGVPLVAGAALEPTLLRAMTFMIVASPCAVVLATMPPLLAAIATAGRRGVLVRSAAVMERLATVSRVAFDKTGTLTEGVPRVVAVHAVELVHAVRPGPGGPATVADVLGWAAAAERPSEHPLALAIVRAARARALDLPVASDFSAAPGRGVTAVVAGVRVAVGQIDHVLAPHPGDADDRATRALVTAAERAGRTAVVVSLDGQPAGVIELADRLRPSARAVAERISALTDRPPVLLTGDNARAAAQLAGEAGIVDVRASLLPADKVAAVAGFQADGDRVMVVGDGINDAPALATADVGVAMGGVGSDLAVETADVVVVRDDLGAIPTVLALARRARRLVLQNLAIAGACIAVLATWDIVGRLPLPLGVAGHEGSTVLVALNGLRLLRHADA
jgi:heavy metal translocating P-type ATPase